MGTAVASADGPMAKSTRRHRPRALRPSSRDAAFLRTFAVTLLGLLAGIAGLVRVTDPLAVFGSALLPPIVTADRDYKPTLYRARRESPEIVVLGSSRVKTIRPECIRALTGRPAFNFGVNAGVAEDFLAIFRFIRAQPGFRVRQILLGAEPEAFTGDVTDHRSLARSRALGGFVTQAPDDPDQIWSDLLSEASLTAALRSVRHYGFGRGTLPQEALGPDGLQVHPLWDQEIRTGRFPQQSRVSQTSRTLRAHYVRRANLSPTRLGRLHQLLREARAAGVLVTAFVPPVHPALAREAAGTGYQRLTEELVGVLRAAQGQGLLQYVETRSMTDFSGDTTLYYDAIHMTAENTDRLLAAVYRGAGRCALQ